MVQNVQSKNLMTLLSHQITNFVTNMSHIGLYKLTIIVMPNLGICDSHLSQNCVVIGYLGP